MNYITINNIIDDIMLQMRRNNITESESYNRRQIEQWIIQYRALFITTSMLKNLPLSQNYYQSFYINLEQVKINQAGAPSQTIRRSAESIPESCSGIPVASYDTYGTEIQVMSEKRARSNHKRRYFIDSRPVAYLDEKRRYCLSDNTFLNSVKISGVFVNPSAVPFYNHAKDVFPIEISDLPEIKRLIFTNELKFNIVPDTKNDGIDNIAIAPSR